MLVASQPSGAPTWFPCNDHPFDKASYRHPVRDRRRVHRRRERRARRAPRRQRARAVWVYEQREPTASYLLMVQVGRYAKRALALRRSRRPRCTSRAPLERRVRADFGPLPRDARGVRRAASGPTRSSGTRWSSRPTSSRSRSRRRGSRVFGANHIDGARRRGAAHRARARPPVVRQQRRRRALAGHLAQRGLLLLRRVAVVGCLGRGHGRRARPASTTRGSRSLPAGPDARRSRARPTCSTTGSTSAAR